MDDDAEAAQALRQGVTRLARRLRRARPGAALSAAKIGVLGHLARRGSSSAGELAAADGQRPQALTRVLAELEAEGLITRAPSSSDARSVVLSPTQAGLDALERDMAARDQWMAAALSDLDDTERGLLRLAAPLLDRLADHVLTSTSRTPAEQHPEEKQ